MPVFWPCSKISMITKTVDGRIIGRNQGEGKTEEIMDKRGATRTSRSSDRGYPLDKSLKMTKLAL